MINKEQYDQGIRCKGMCCFCQKNSICYQGIQYNKKEDVADEDKSMTISEAIEYLKTLKQDYKIKLGDSEYPNCEFTKDSVTEGDNKTYIFY